MFKYQKPNIFQSKAKLNTKAKLNAAPTSYTLLISGCIGTLVLIEVASS